MSKRPGFTLIELIVALCISTFILVAIIGVASQMIRFQFEAAAKGTSSAWTLIGLDQLNRDLQDASYLKTPPYTTVQATLLAGSPTLHGCHNYSQFKRDSIGNGIIDPDPSIPTNANPKNPMYAFYYCVAQIDTVSGRAVNGLLRFQQNGVCPMTTPMPPACPTPCTSAQNCAVVARDVSQGAAGASVCQNYFCRADDATGVLLNFQIGVSTDSQTPVPRYARINTKISMNKSYMNTSD